MMHHQDKSHLDTQEVTRRRRLHSQRQCPDANSNNSNGGRVAFFDSVC